MDQTTQTTTANLNERAQQTYRVALDLYRQKPTWMAFFREILGIDGVVNRQFPTREMLETFQNTEEHLQIQQMLTNLREADNTRDEGREPTRVITVRLPRSLHESLRAEARDRNTSMNKLCITKLLSILDDELEAPTETA